MFTFHIIHILFPISRPCIFFFFWRVWCNLIWSIDAFVKKQFGNIDAFVTIQSGPLTRMIQDDLVILTLLVQYNSVIDAFNATRFGQIDAFIATWFGHIDAFSAHQFGTVDAFNTITSMRIWPFGLFLDHLKAEFWNFKHILIIRGTKSTIYQISCHHCWIPLTRWRHLFNLACRPYNRVWTYSCY